MRILWVSNARSVKTGYGVQTDLFVPRISKAGFPTAIMSLWGVEGAPIIDADGIITYPRFAESFGNDIVAAHAAHWRADLIFSLFDVGVFQPTAFLSNNCVWAAWTPIDSAPILPACARVLKKVTNPVAMSRYGKN